MAKKKIGSGVDVKGACGTLEHYAVKTINRLAKKKQSKVVTAIYPNFQPARLDAVLSAAQKLNCQFLEGI